MIAFNYTATVGARNCELDRETDARRTYQANRTRHSSMHTCVSHDAHACLMSSARMQATRGQEPRARRPTHDGSLTVSRRQRQRRQCWRGTCELLELEARHSRTAPATGFAFSQPCPRATSRSAALEDEVGRRSTAPPRRRPVGRVSSVVARWRCLRWCSLPARTRSAPCFCAARRARTSSRSLLVTRDLGEAVDGPGPRGACRRWLGVTAHTETRVVHT